MPTPLENCRHLLELLDAQPDNLVDLDAISVESACGTVYCLLGLAGTSPHFHAQGLHYENVGDESLLYLGDRMCAYWDRDIGGLFGLNPERLFAPECNIGGYESYRTLGPYANHKELARLRLLHHIKLLEA